MPCTTTWVHDTAVQLVRKFKEERESSKEEAAAVAQALAKVKARNQEVGAELASGLARKSAAEQEVSNAEHRLQSTRESILRLEQQEAVAAVSLAHKDSQISLLQQCQNFVEHQVQLLQNQQDETKKCQQEVLSARQEASSAQEAAFKVKLEADNLHQALNAVKAARDKHAEEVEQLRRMLDDVKTLCGKRAAEAEHLRYRLSEIEATRAKLAHQVSQREIKPHATCREHDNAVRGERGVKQSRVELDNEANTFQSSDKNEIMAATSTVKEAKPASTVNGPTVRQADASQALDKKETTAPMSTVKETKPAGTVQGPTALNQADASQALDRKETTAATSIVRETTPAGIVDGPIASKEAVSAEAASEVVTSGEPTEGKHADQFKEQRDHRADEPGQLQSPNDLEALQLRATRPSGQTNLGNGIGQLQSTTCFSGKPQQDTAGLRECSNAQEQWRPGGEKQRNLDQAQAGKVSAPSCSVTVASSTLATGSKSAAPDASRPDQVSSARRKSTGGMPAQKGFSSISPDHELSKTAVVPHPDLPQTPRPWRSATAYPPAKYQRTSGPAELLANSCQECGLKKQIFLDASDNMHYCSDCWVAFYGRLPTSTAGTPHRLKHPVAADHAGLSIDWRCKQGTPDGIKRPVAAHKAKLPPNLRCKQGGEFKCPQCPNTFTAAKNLRRHLESGSCRGPLE